MHRNWWIICFAFPRCAVRTNGAGRAVSAESVLLKEDNHGALCPLSAQESSGTCRRATSERPGWEESADRVAEAFADPILSKRTRATAVQTYHLLWSPGAWKKIAMTSLFLFCLHFFHESFNGHLAHLMQWTAKPMPIAIWDPFATFATNAILPLMASACCLIQLFINVLAGGCAGFNTYLGPVRPFFLSLLLYLTAITASWTPRWLGKTTFRWTVALLPEALHLWNRYWEEAETSQQEREKIVPPSLQATVQLDIPSMGCVACINTIDQALRKASPDRVLEAASSLNPLGAKGGKAMVRLSASSEAEVYQVVDSLLVSVQAAGFGDSTVESVRKAKL